jgi:hypothetical protein
VRRVHRLVRVFALFLSGVMMAAAQPRAFASGSHYSTSHPLYFSLKEEKYYHFNLLPSSSNNPAIR